MNEEEAIKALNIAIEKTQAEIKAYKELEYKYNKALSDLVQAEHKNKELKEENKIWKDNYYEQKEFNNKQALYIIDNFIPVSLVEETIEELNKKEKQELKGLKGQDRYFVKQMYQYKRSVLRELLEKR